MSNSSRILFILLALILILFWTGVPLEAEHGSLPQARPSAVLGATEEVLREVSELRGLKVLGPVKAEIQSRAQIERSLIQQIDEQNTPDEFDAEAKALRMLGLIPQDFKLREFLIRLLTEQIAGYYRPKTKVLYLADWLSLDEQRTVMVHELMHALQDQHFHLERFEDPLKGDSDRDLAIHALIEGEATAVMVNYLLKPHQLDITRIPVPLAALFDQIQLSNNGGGEVLRSAPASIRESLMFPYTYGTQFVQYLLSHASWTRVSEAYKRLPDSSEQILHPDRFVTPDEPTVIKLAPLEPILGRGWKKRLFDVSGEFGYFFILSEFIDREVARQAAEGWAGDQLVLYENSQTGQLLLAHISLWDSVNEAEEFTDGYAQRIKRRYAEVEQMDGKPKLARYWKTMEGLVYVERRGKKVLVIETAGTLPQSRLRMVAQRLWKYRR